MNYAEWEDGVPSVIREDSLWTVEAYRLSLFLADISWHDVTKLSKDKRTYSLSDQLYRSVGSMSANIESYCKLLTLSSISDNYENIIYATSEIYHV